MDTFKRTPMQLFTMPQHFLIPLFQRPYVWREDEQWEPLWQDVRRVTELRLKEPHLNAQHFLGAIVLQAHDGATNQIPTWNVIDGQQRLTTLQLLADATSAVFAQAGLDRYASQLDALTHNPANYLPDGESQLKVRHLNNDHDAYDEVMGAEPPVDYAGLKAAQSRLAQAHRYFTEAVTAWLGNPDEPEHEQRAAGLAMLLQNGLQLITIELLASENSQEIFETLNARGTPLTAADLVRNLVFQRLQAEGRDTARAYREDWPFETRFWAKEISVGRYLVSRSSLFLNQWLAARLGEEISPQATFARFKALLDQPNTAAVGELLPVLRDQARLYEQWTEAAARPDGSLSTTEMAVYRMRAGGIELLKPLLIWLHEPGRDLPTSVIDAVIRAAESWVMRRQILRLTSSDLGRIVADLIKTQDSAPVDQLAARVSGQLARLDVTSTYWPGDAEVRAALSAEPVYRRFSRARLRVYLEAAENAVRSETGQPQVERSGFPIEHILPQSWQKNWPVDPSDEQNRQEHVHRLGNLTLLTSGLNSKVSNSAWATKRQALLEHNTVKITGRLVNSETWDERCIDRRTTFLTDLLLSVWSAPPGHEGKVADPQSKSQDWVQLRHLVEGGLLHDGDTLVATHRDFPGATAHITADGRIRMDDRAFETPSGAAYSLRRRATNGWYFWALPDGRRLRDLRSELLWAQ